MDPFDLIGKRIQDLSDLYDNDGPSAMVPESRPMFANGQLVQPNANGSRPGYKGNKTYPFKRPDGKTDYRLGLDEDTGKFFKKIGKEDNIRTITQNEGESIEDFKKRKAERVTKVNDATVGARQYVDNWTKNWFDNNLKKYGINSFNVMMDDLSSAWQLQLESGDVPKGKGSFNLSTSKLKLPNITTLADVKGKPNLTPFKYNNVTFYKNLESTDALKNKTLAQFKKVFYKDQINNNPKLQEDLTKFFDFMSSNKQGQYRKLDGKTIKDFMNTEVSDEVKFLLNPEISGLDKASKKEVFNSYSDFADNYNKYTEDKVRLRAVQAETEALAKVGKKTADQYLKVKADIAKQNDVLGKMSIKDIASNKELLNSVRMSINPRTGEVSYTNYTVNDPKGKAALTDLELAKKIKQKAIDKNFYVTEHIGKKSFNKANLAFPNNIQSANYMSNSQLENARRFLSIAENRNTPAAQNLDKTLENFKLTIRGPEYGDKRIGNKMDIVFDSKTGVSNIVQEQAINRKANILSSFCNRKGFKLAGSVDGLTCSMGEIQTNMKKQINEAKKVSKDGKIPKKFGKLRAVAGSFFGDIAIPLEYMFMAPDLVAGDIDGALRSSTASLFGAGKVDLDKLPEGEAKKYIKHTNAISSFLKNYQSKLMAENSLQNLEVGDEGQSIFADQLAQAEKNMLDITKAYSGFGYTYEPGEKGLLEGKVATQKFIRDKVASDFDKKIDKGASTEFFKDSNKDILKQNIRGLGGDPYEVTPINNLKDYIKNKGEATAGNTNIILNRLPYTLDQAEAYGVGDIFDTYAGGYAGVETPGSMQDGEIDMGTKDVRDAYSSLPIDLASQLAALEKKEFEEGMYKKRLEQGFAGGGIAKVAGVDKGPAPQSGPQPQGLSYLFNRVKKVQE